MENIQKQIMQDSITFLKEKNKDGRATLTGLLSLMKNKALDLKVDVLDDATSISTIQKFIKQLEDELDAFKQANREDRVTTLTYQLDLVKKYLPTFLTSDEIKEIILSLPDQSVKCVMPYFKQNYTGKVDMGLVSKVIKSLS